MLLHTSARIHSSVCTPPISASSTPCHAPAVSQHHGRRWTQQQPPPIRPNELSPHCAHQTLILAVKHCCMLRHLLHPQDLFWERVPHGSLPPDSFQTRPDCAPGRFNLSTALCQVAHAFHYLYLTDFTLVSIFCILNYSTIVPVSSNDTPSSVHAMS